MREIRSADELEVFVKESGIDYERVGDSFVFKRESTTQTAWRNMYLIPVELTGWDFKDQYVNGDSVIRLAL